MTLAISDVPDDDQETIGSGPTHPSESSERRRPAASVLARYVAAGSIPESVAHALNESLVTPPYADGENQTIASGSDAAEEIIAEASQHGLAGEAQAESIVGYARATAVTAVRQFRGVVGS